MNYPIVYDKFESAFNNFGLAILEGAKNVKIKKIINGEYTLSFILPRNDAKWSAIVEENFIKVEDQLYRIRTFSEIRDNTGKLLSNIQCEHVWYDANDCKHIPLFEMIGATPYQILTAAFIGTNFTVGTVDAELDNTDIELSKTNPAAVVSKLIENVGGELEIDNYSVGLRKNIGNYNGVQFRTGKNNSDIKKTTNSKTLCTRLYAYGIDDLDITSVNAGVAYLDSPYINDYDYIHEKYIDFNDIDDPAELMEEALKKFSTETTDGIDKPEVTIEANIIELKKINKRFETFALGDTTIDIDEDLNININARIMEYEYYPYEPNKSNVVLKNFKRNLSDLIVSLADSRNKVTNITTDKGKVKVDWLENIIEKISTEIEEGLTKKAVVHDQGDIWVDDIENPTKAMAIVNGMFAIADNKKDSGDWDWRTFGTGSGFVADLITAGVVRLSDELTIENDNGTVKLDSTGMQITETGVAQAIIKGGQIALQVWDAETNTWLNGLYFDTVTKKFIFNGTLSATTIEAIKAQIDVLVSNTTIVNNLYAEYGRIANLAVSELDTSYKKITNYLLKDTDLATSISPVRYRRLYDDKVEVWICVTDGLTDELVYGADGAQLYWTDDTHTQMHVEITEYPVKQWVYIEELKKVEGTELVNGTYLPYIVDGVGDEVLEMSGKFKMQKNTDGEHLTYYMSNTSEEITLEIGEEGIHQIGSTGDKGIRNVAVGTTEPTSPQLNDLWIDTST